MINTPDRKDLKWDDGKLQYELILPEFLELMAEILTKGEINHPKVNGQPSWQLVEPDAYKNALWRHFQEYRKQHNSLDKEMNTHHLGHVAVNSMFLWWLSKKEDDLHANKKEAGSSIRHTTVAEAPICRPMEHNPDE